MTPAVRQQLIELTDLAIHLGPYGGQAVADLLAFAIESLPKPKTEYEGTILLLQRDERDAVRQLLTEGNDRALQWRDPDVDIPETVVPIYIVYELIAHSDGAIAMKIAEQSPIWQEYTKLYQQLILYSNPAIEPVVVYPAD